MDDKMTELFQQGKYLKGLKRYIEVAAEETHTTQHFSETLPPNENQTLVKNTSQASGRNSHMNQQSTVSANRPALQQRHTLHQQSHSLAPSKRKITKESIIKYDRNSSAGSVALALLLIIILSVVFFSTL